MAANAEQPPPSLVGGVHLGKPRLQRRAGRYPRPPVGRRHAALAQRGESFCTSGATNGEHCGWKIDAVNADWRYGTGEVARNTTHASKMGQCIIGGDSGGPAYVKNFGGASVFAYRLISGVTGFGGSDAFASPGEGACRTVITDIHTFKDAFGGTVLTG